MINFFRKLRYDFMVNNKTTKYLKYALGETILVVIGILIALQINNWNENRKTLSKEKYYLNSIRTSIAMSQDELSRVINDANLISNCADTLFQILAYKQYDNFDGIFIDSLLFASADYSLISLNDAGIQEVLNTGSLDIIKNNEIRIIIASWDERLHKVRKFESETEYIARNYGNYLNPFIDSRIYEIDSSSSVIIPEKRKVLLEDPQLANYLAKIQFTHYGMYTMYSEERQVLDSLDILINIYLNEKF